MKQQSQKEIARDSIASHLRNEYERATSVLRDHPDGVCRTYRRERKRLLLVALKAVLKSK